MELFPEDSPTGTCKRQAPDVDRFQKGPCSCFLLLRTAFLLRRVVYKRALKRYILVLMKNDLNRLVGAQQLARATARTVYFNLSFALGVIVVVGVFALGGKVPLPMGVVAHEGGTVFVVLVGLRLLAHRVGS